MSYDLHNSDYDNEVQTEYERKFSSLGTPINFVKWYFKRGCYEETIFDLG